MKTKLNTTHATFLTIFAITASSVYAANYSGTSTGSMGSTYSSGTTIDTNTGYPRSDMSTLGDTGQMSADRDAMLRQQGAYSTSGQYSTTAPTTMNTDYQAPMTSTSTYSSSAENTLGTVSTDDTTRMQELESPSTAGTRKRRTNGTARKRSTTSSRRKSTTSTRKPRTTRSSSTTRRSRRTTETTPATPDTTTFERSQNADMYSNGSGYNNGMSQSDAAYYNEGQFDYSRGQYDTTPYETSTTRETPMSNYSSMDNM